MAKGYRPSARKNRRTAAIAFAPGHEFHGAEATVALTASLDFVLSIEGMDGESSERKRALMLSFGDSVLVDWNVEDEDGPVPANGEGFLAQDMDFAVALMRAWSDAMVNPPAPLSLPSNEREPSGDSTGGSSGSTRTASPARRRAR